MDKPGLIYATLPPGTPVEIQAAMKNIFDNLFYLTEQVIQLSKNVPSLATNAKPGRRTTRSGIYTPVLTNVLNLSASSIESCQWCMIGDPVPVCMVSGRVSIDPVAGGSVQLGISLPIFSNLTDAFQCGGVAFCNNVAGQGAAILGDPVNNRAQMEWIAVDVSPKVMYFIFEFRVV